MNCLHGETPGRCWKCWREAYREEHLLVERFVYAVSKRNMDEPWILDSLWQNRSQAEARRTEIAEECGMTMIEEMKVGKCAGCEICTALAASND